MKLFVKFCAIIFCMTASAHEAVDLIVFSKNRPLQLYAFLESCERYISGLHAVSIIYYADQPFASCYEEVQAAFPEAQFLRQQTLGPRGDFRALTSQVVTQSEAPYLVFAVDDIVVIDQVDMQRCVQLLEQYKAYGFYLRLGTDITECYSERRHTGQPPLTLREQGVYSWKFCNGTGDWGYPNTVDMTIFRRKEILSIVQKMGYHSPNTFEGNWSGYAGAVMQRRGLCFAYSKIVNLPINLVQNDFNNRHGSDYDVQFLLEKFKQGFRMDVLALHKFPHHAPHAEYQPTFIVREDRYQR